jgi:ubiquinone/menaquinone biosynthesis C-methylase UbiE
VRADPTQTVQRGYDAIAATYARWGGVAPRATKRTYLDLARERTPGEGARLLDLGCGTGEQVTRHLAAGAFVVGVDISSRSLALARRAVPGGAFVHADLSVVSFAPESFDGVVAFFSLIHVPRERHAAVFRSVRAWLRPSGYFIVTVTAGAGEDGTGDFLGVPMYWSGWDAETSVGLIRDAGFTIESAEDQVELEGGDTPIAHRWVVATAS